MVLEHFGDHFGDLYPFYFAVTRDQALQSFHMFIEHRLKDFGAYQDAMIEGEPWMYHSHIGFYLNCGLLLPIECVKAAEEAYKKGKAPLNSVEGFIRQIIGWREYIRGIYWLKMPDYANENFFGVSFLKFIYSTSGASDIILVCPLNLSSLVTGPKILVPIGSPFSSVNTTALLSN